MGKFEIVKRSSSGYLFKLVASNGQVLLVSELYATLAACKGGVQAVIRSAQDDGNFTRKTSVSGSYYFTLKASNGQTLANSEMYASEAGRENGIYSVKMNAKTEVIA